MRKLLTAILLLFIGCKTSQSIDNSSLKEILVFEIKKNGCYGTCPIYQISLYNNHMVKYHGKHFTENLGHYKWKISNNNYKKILDIITKKFQENQEFNMKVQDLPLTQLKIMNEIEIAFKGAIPIIFKKELELIESTLLKNANWK